MPQFNIRQSPNHFETGNVWILTEDERVIAVCPTEADALRIAASLDMVPAVTVRDPNDQSFVSYRNNPHQPIDQE